jgi:hypothetical protein
MRQISEVEKKLVHASLNIRPEAYCDVEQPLPYFAADHGYSFKGNVK